MYLKTIVAAIILLSFTSTIYSQTISPASSASPTVIPSPTPVSKVKGGDKNEITLKLNEHMPGWFKIGGETRMRFENKNGIGGVKDKNDGYMLSRMRLDFTIRPVESLTLFLQVQDSHVVGLNTAPKPASMNNLLDLRQAFIDWRQNGNSGWAVRVGRQEFKYGEEVLIGGGNWGNTSRSFDAVKISRFDEWYNVDIFASSVVVIQDRVFDKRRDGNNLYGIYSTFNHFIPKAETSFYTLWKTAPLVRGELASRGDSDTVTAGVNIVGKLPAKFDYMTDLMLQRGSFASDRIDAYAIRARLGYTITDKYWTPRVLLEYNVASGDKNPTDKVKGTFDQYYPTNHSKYGLDDVVGFRNLENLRAGIGFKPSKKWKIDVDYHSFWLAQEKDGLYNEQGNLIARDITGTSGKHVAEEADIQVTFSPKEYLNVGGVFAQWFPGRFWKSTTPGSSGSSFYTWVTYKF